MFKVGSFDRFLKDDPIFDLLREAEAWATNREEGDPIGIWNTDTGNCVSIIYMQKIFHPYVKQGETEYEGKVASPYGPNRGS